MPLRKLARRLRCSFQPRRTRRRAGAPSGSFGVPCCTQGDSSAAFTNVGNPSGADIEVPAAQKRLADCIRGNNPVRDSCPLGSERRVGKEGIPAVTLRSRRNPKKKRPGRSFFRNTPSPRGKGRKQLRRKCAATFKSRYLRSPPAARPPFCRCGGACVGCASLGLLGWRTIWGMPTPEAAQILRSVRQNGFDQPACL